MAVDVNRTVVAYSAFKDAALYFPHVVPLFGQQLTETFLELFLERSADIEKDGIQKIKDRIPTQGVLKAILPPEISSSKVGSLKLAQAGVGTSLGPMIDIMRALKSDKHADEFAGKVNEAAGANIGSWNDAQKVTRELYDDFGLDKCPLLCDDTLLLLAGDELDEDENEDNEDETPESGRNGDADLSGNRLVLAKSCLVDTTNASWEQILEIRRDESSVEKLRRLVHFMDASYAEKSPAFIEDDLKTRMAEYEAAAKHHGFALSQMPLEVAAGSQGLKALGTAAVVFALKQLAESHGLDSKGLIGTGMVDIASAALAVGGLIGVVQDAVGLGVRGRTKKSEFRKYQEMHELAFILSARERLKNRS